jgi:hypothetical protein
MKNSNNGSSLRGSLRGPANALPFNWNVKLVILNNLHTEILGGPGPSWVQRSVDFRPRVARFSVTHLCVYRHQFGVCWFGAGEEFSRDHELTAVGMQPVWMQGGAIA